MGDLVTFPADATPAGEPVTPDSLNARIEQLLTDESRPPNPADVARQVAAEVPDRFLRAALAKALIAYTIRAANGRRRRAERHVDERPDAADGEMVMVRKGQWKRLRDCKAPDLRRMAEFLRVAAADATANADRYELMAQQREAAIARRDGVPTQQPEAR